MPEPGRVEKVQNKTFEWRRVEEAWLVSDTEQILASRMSAGRSGGSGKFPQKLSVEF